MSKGSKRRLSFVSADEYANNYDRIFKGVESEIPTATQVECTAIIKRPDVWPMRLGQVDLTKMTHPEACKYLEVGMRVKVLCGGPNFVRGWHDSWTDAMVEAVGKTYTISTIDSRRGVTVEKYILSFPAFCLQIIEPGQENEG